MEGSSVNVMPVTSCQQSERVFLDLVSDASRGVVVIRPSTLCNSSAGYLPKRWPYWVRDLVLENATVVDAISVRLAGEFVYVRSARDFQRAFSSALVAAGQVHELVSSGLRRPGGDQPHWKSRSSWFVWPERGQDVVELAESVGERLQRVVMPKGCHIGLVIDDWAVKRPHIIVTLERDKRGRRHVLSLRELSQIFEMRFQLASQPTGVHV